jgi:hypothetical protein
MDFVADQLVGGTKIRILTIVDVRTREALRTRVGQRLRGEHVVDICNRLVASRGAPVRVLVDNGSEFSGRPLGLWAYHHGVQIDLSRPGKPTGHCFVETFNGSLRDERLNVHWFGTLAEATRKIEAWRVEYNESRPHQALKETTPAQFAGICRTSELSEEQRSARKLTLEMVRKTIAVQEWPSPSNCWHEDTRQGKGTLFEFVQALTSRLPATALAKRDRHGGSAPKTHLPRHRREETQQFHPKSPSQTSEGPLFQGNANPAREPRPNPTRPGRENGFQRRRIELPPQGVDGKGLGENEKTSPATE